MRNGIEKGTVRADSDEAKGRFAKGYTDIKSANLETRTIDGVASTIELDRDGEVILPSAFKARMGKFLGSNAPFNSSHLHRLASGGPPQIGWVMEAGIETDKVSCKFRFGTTEIGEQWWLLASDKEGKGIAFSIGFRPLKWISGMPAELVRMYPELKAPFARANVPADRKIWVYTEIELLEISAVGCPSNRESVQLAVAKAFGMDGDDDAGEMGHKLLAKIAAEVVKRIDAPAMADVEQKIADAADALSADLQKLIDEIIVAQPDTLGIGGLQDPPGKQTGPGVYTGNPNDDAGDGGGKGPDNVQAAAAALLKSATTE